jgi:hypothetical protein
MCHHDGLELLIQRVDVVVVHDIGILGAPFDCSLLSLRNFLHLSKEIGLKSLLLFQGMSLSYGMNGLHSGLDFAGSPAQN